MKTLNAYFSSDDGVLRAGEQVLAAPRLTRAEFDRGIGRGMNGENSAPGFIVYGPVSILIWGKEFKAGLRFFNDVVHGVTMSLAHSRVASLGYDATEEDLLTEKKTLTKMLSKHLSCLPASTSLGADVFEFPWGGIVVRADQKSTWCGIELWFK